MKHWLLFILVISWFCFPLSGQQTNRPDWVKQHPVSGLSYIGIGMAEISEGDYQQKAKQNALSDLVSEIQVVIAANSLLNTLEDDGNVKQTFAESIRTEARAEIENFRLVDSWRSDNEYWVYYELNKGDYAPWWKHVVRRQSVTDSIFGIRDTLLYNREINDCH